MSIYSTTVNYTNYNVKYNIKEKDIEKKEDYSYIPYWENTKFNEGTNAAQF